MPPKKQKSTLVCLKEIGVDRPYVAERIKTLLDSEDEKIKLQASRMYLALTAEISNDKAGAVSIVGNAPTMVIIGASRDRIRALREGPVPELPEEINAGQEPADIN